ncbi:MAG: CBS domain-containing protein [Pirellulaceae bacterium]
MDFHLDLNTEPVTHAHPAKPVCVKPNTTVREVIETLRQHKTGSLLICRDGELLGVFTERDALKLIAKGGDFDVSIQQAMIANPVTLRPTDTVGVAINKMASGGYRRLPIVNKQGQPEGLVKVSGILHYLVEHFPSIIYTLPPSPHHTLQQREGA